MERGGGGRLAAVAIGAAISIGAGGPTGNESKKSTTPQVTVTACVEGGLLSKVSAAGDTSNRTFGPRYRLSGPKALVKEIKRDHAGHVDEFTGSTSGDLDATGTGRTVDLGKLSVQIGSVNDQPNAARVPETPVFQVASFKHTDARCR